jgi:RND family efflux transporter MFP subunit
MTIRSSAMATAAAALLLAAVAAPAAAQQVAKATGLPTVTVRAGGAGQADSAYDGVVEAVRQTVVAAQVPGAVVALEVRAGDMVKAGQLLARIDARTAEHNASAAQAQVKSAQAILEVATKDFERQKQLYAKQYISQAALERAESQFKATQAQAAALLAQAGAAGTQSGLHMVRAPYAGVVAEVPVALGDMAMPGKPLVVLYEPGALRVTAAVPQSVVGAAPKQARVEFPTLAAEPREFAAAQVQVLPTVDPQTHTVQLRIPLPAGWDVKPGLFARVWLPSAGVPSQRIVVPASAIVRRAEVTGVYVLDANGAPVLRQVRLGRASGEGVELLAGVAAGERVVTDPQAAARAQ